MTRKELLQEIISVQIETKQAMFGHFQRACAGSGLSPAPLHLLMTLKGYGRASSKDLASKLNLTPGAVSQMVETLEQSGFIAREQNEQDRRVTHLSISNSGQQKILGWQKKRDQMFTDAFANLTDQELATFLKVQKSLLTYLKNSNQKEEK